MGTKDWAEDDAQPIDVWLRFEGEEEHASHEANTFRTEDGDFRVEWYHTSVGLVSNVYFPTYEEACIWYEENGYQNFTS